MVVTKCGIHHSNETWISKDLEVLFTAAGATDSTPGAVKYMEFITYLWSPGKSDSVWMVGGCFLVKLPAFSFTCFFFEE